MIKIISYRIKQAIVTKPEIALPRGSQVVSVKHHDKYEPEGNGEVSECWQVVWLEPRVYLGSLAKSDEEEIRKQGRAEIIKAIEDNAGETLFLLENLEFWKTLKEDTK